MTASTVLHCRHPPLEPALGVPRPPASLPDDKRQVVLIHPIHAAAQTFGDLLGCQEAIAGIVSGHRRRGDYHRESCSQPELKRAELPEQRTGYLRW
jgi:hypothetical protein